MSEFAGQVRSALSDQAKRRVPGASERIGYFSAPFRPMSGPLSGCVVKPFRAGRDPEVLEPLLRRHETYVDCLERAGLRVPRTRLILMDEHGLVRPVIVQDAISPDALATQLVQTADLETVLDVMEAVALAICAFWAGVAQRPERIGLHASLRNFGFDADARPVFLDTFPPLIGLSREEIGRLLLRFSESGLIRGIGALLPGRAREIQDPWYTLPGNLALLTETAIRTRAQDALALLQWAEVFARSHLSASDRSALLTALNRPRPRVAAPAAKRRFGFGARPNA